MKYLQVFNNKEFGEIRGVNVAGTPYFVGRDVAEALGYVAPRNAVKDHVDKEDIKVLKYSDCKACIDLRQSLWNKINDFSNKILINESGVYSLIFGSELPNAKKFKRWVTSEVLPQIRQTGGYIPVTTEMTEEEIMARALQISQKTIEQQQKQLEQQKPIVSAYKRFLDAGDNMDFNTFAKMLGIGRNKLLNQLREWNVLQGEIRHYQGQEYKSLNWNMPYQKYVDKGYFAVKQVKLPNGQFKPVTLVTPLGATAIAKKIEKDLKMV